MEQKKINAAGDLQVDPIASLGIKRKLRRGNPGHPLGRCTNPGWSVPEKIRLAVAQIAEDTKDSESQIVTRILSEFLSSSASAPDERSHDSDRIA